MDLHSYSRPEERRVEHLVLDLECDFSRRVLRGSVELRLAGSGPQLVLDTRALTIHKVTHAGGEAAYTMGEADAILGAPLTIELPPGAQWVRIEYETSPEATALQWCEPAQTAGKRHPFLYTQSQAIHARSWIPLQDSPGVRVTFDAAVRNSAGLTAILAAEVENRGTAQRFHMRHPIPPYLIALAVGELEFRPLGRRAGVYAEPGVVDEAAHEFADTEAMIAAVEEMFGPYRWGRYDVLVLPPSFPYGGMENPCLTFATPTILAGDRSLVSLVAHELAHSWSGNLVTNATWRDFWLNEGFTVYVERRILERIYGAERAQMEAALARGELLREMAGMEARDQVLHIDLSGRDPDEGCTLVPYEKGALFLTAIEQTVGRPHFDWFIRAYFDRFAFQSITTEQFTEYLRKELPEAAPLIEEWIERPGIPASAPAAPEPVFTGTTHQALHLLRTTERPMEELDREHKFTESKNAEILSQWLLLAVQRNYAPAFGKLEEFLLTVGRRKFIKPLYAELMKANPALAQRIYARARAAYHPIAQATIDAIVTGSSREP